MNASSAIHDLSALGLAVLRCISRRPHLSYSRHGLISIFLTKMLSPVQRALL